jgi:membrane-bound ClpP family serine protease
VRIRFQNYISGGGKMKYCPECGNKIEGEPKFCGECGSKIVKDSSSKGVEIGEISGIRKSKLPYEAQSIKDLNNIAGVVALLFGIIFLVIGILTLLFFIGIFFIIFAIIDFTIKSKLKEINSLINKKEYMKAKSKELIWVILGFLFGGIIIGIIVLLAYIKYDDLLRTV